jgi:mRNA interferase RelE/StbE
VSRTYRVEVARRALKSLAALPHRERQRVRGAIDLLADTPRPPNCVAMQGEKSTHHVRVGDYRIVYEVHDTVLLVQVVRTGHRREVYR